MSERTGGDEEDEIGAAGDHRGLAGLVPHLNSHMANLTKAEVAQAFKHPLRQRLMRTFIAHRPLSPREASLLLNEPLSDVSYHVKVLVEYGLLVLRARAQVRGALKSYYLPNDETLNLTTVKEFFARNPSIRLD